MAHAKEHNCSAAWQVCVCVCVFVCVCQLSHVCMHECILPPTLPSSLPLSPPTLPFSLSPLLPSQVYAEMQNAGCVADEGTWVALITAHARETRKGPGSIADARVIRVVELMRSEQVGGGMGEGGGVHAHVYDCTYMDADVCEGLCMHACTYTRMCARSRRWRTL